MAVFRLLLKSNLIFSSSVCFSIGHQMCDVAKGYVIGMTYNNNNNRKNIMHQLKEIKGKAEKKMKKKLQS